MLNAECLKKIACCILNDVQIICDTTKIGCFHFPKKNFAALLRSVFFGKMQKINFVIKRQL